MEAVRRQFETNVFGLVQMTQLVLPGMRRQKWGRIVNVGSMGGKLVFPGGGFYHGTKFAVEAISDALRFEVRPFGIGVSIIEPGAIRTQFEATSTGTLASPTSSPYASFSAGVAERNASAYKGAIAADADLVARVIERAISSKRPRSRYPITAAARVLLTTRRLLPDQAWDMMMRMQYPSPKV